MSENRTNDPFCKMSQFYRIVSPASVIILLDIIPQRCFNLFRTCEEKWMWLLRLCVFVFFTFSHLVFLLFHPYHPHYVPPCAHHLCIRWRRTGGALAGPPSPDGAPCLQTEAGGRRLAAGEPQARWHGVCRRGRHLQERAIQTASVL